MVFEHTLRMHIHDFSSDMALLWVKANAQLIYVYALPLGNQYISNCHTYIEFLSNLMTATGTALPLFITRRYAAVRSIYKEYLKSGFSRSVRS